MHVTVPRWLLAVSAATWLTACASARAPSVTTAPASRPVVATSGDELPPGRGRTILDTSCTSCHGLNEVTKFRGFYDRAQWRDIVVTMVEYGAPLKPEDAEVLTVYLTEQLGK